MDMIEQIILVFKGQYGKLPDVAAIKDIIDSTPDLQRQKRIHEDPMGNVWSRGERIGHMDDGRFIPLYAYGVPDDVQMVDYSSPERFMIEYIDKHRDKALVVTEGGNGPE